MSGSDGLIQRVDYRRLAATGGVVEGTLALSTLPRVAAETVGGVASGDKIDVALTLDEDSQRRVHVGGRIATRLRLTCQRCLCAYDHAVAARVAAVVVADDAAAANLARAYEPVMADGDTLDVHALVGDELLLALPVVARCQRPACAARFGPADAPDRPSPTARRDKPFAALADLKHRH